MAEDLSPEGINNRHGKATWTCWHCKAETRLHWHNGWSVAVCNDRPECAGAYNAMIQAELESQESYEAHCREYFG